MRRGISVIYFGNEQIRLDKEQDSNDLPTRKIENKLNVVSKSQQTCCFVVVPD